MGIGFAQTVDPKGSRTIAVFTKIDLLQSGNSLPSLVQGILYKLPLGYIGIVCRSQEEIDSGMSINEQLENEKAFFSKSEYQSNQELYGINALKQKLDKEFKKHILLSLPKLRKTLDEKILENNMSLNALAEPIPDINHLESHTHQMIDRYFTLCEGLLDRSLVSIEYDIDYRGVLFRNNHKEFYKSMDAITTLFNMPAEKVKRIIQNKSGMEGTYPISDSLIRSILLSNIEKLKPTLLQYLKDVSITYDKFIELVEDKELMLYKNLKRCFRRKIIEVKNKNLAETQKQIEFLVRLECDCVDPDLVPLANFASTNSPETVLDSVIKNYFLNAKRSLKENTTKYVKHFFIKKNLSDSRSELHSFINKQSDIANFYEEAVCVETERKILCKKKEGFEMIHYYLKEIEIDFS